ncbi:MAG: pyruvate formate lyase family protein [candidate division KSB1 bacterium]|jgi:formate C-acetyltransferase|nr:pyruvate formate lyase family protein [candidate division KSB1 bacterium]
MNASLSYQKRIDALRETKMRHTREKWDAIGAMDFDDHAIILPPPESRNIVEVISGSGVPITDVLLKEFQPSSNHPSGGFFGARSCGENFRDLLQKHPVYVDPMSSLAGGYMVNFLSYRDPMWNPDFDYAHLRENHDKYKLQHGIGAVQHFCQDMTIGLDLGWQGILEKIARYRKINTDDEAQELYDGLEHFVLGFQNWIERHAAEARRLAENEAHGQLRENLFEIAAVNEKIKTDPPETFREACQWVLWYQIAGKMYNMGGSCGRIDQFLYPYYQNDKKAGTLSDEDAIFHLACILVQDTSYTQLGGPDKNGVDQTNELSYLFLEAAHRMKIPANIGVCVGKNVDPGLMKRGLEIMFQDKTGIPKFLGVDNTSAGFARNGYPVELGRERVYSGCHWCAIPGREYTVNDCVKVNLAAVFEVALKEMMSEPGIQPDTEALWKAYEKHLAIAVDTIRESLDYHIDHMYKVFPELHLDLLCHGPIERGRDASHGGVEFTNLCIDGAGLATVADSFAAIEQRVEKEGVLSWDELMKMLDSDWEGTQGEKTRIMMRNIPRYGSGGSIADEYGVRAADLFTRIVKSKPTPKGYNLIPGIFSWAATILLGQDVGATPNGRHARAPISHGPNPDPGFRKDGAPTAIAEIVAATQPGYGNTAPMQLEIDPGMSKNGKDSEKIASLIRTHFELGGTQINLNVIDKKRVMEAHEDPSRHPDLVVRVTGFSAYFASLSPEFRQIVVDRIIAEENE